MCGGKNPQELEINDVSRAKIVKKKKEKEKQDPVCPFRECKHKKCVLKRFFWLEATTDWNVSPIGETLRQSWLCVRSSPLQTDRMSNFCGARWKIC